MDFRLLVISVLLGYAYTTEIDCDTLTTELKRRVCRKLHGNGDNSQIVQAAKATGQFAIAQVPLSKTIEPLNQRAQFFPETETTKEINITIPGWPRTYELNEEFLSCMDLGCICQHIGGNGGTGSNSCEMNGLPVQKSLRKEYRMLTDEERQRFHSAINKIKFNSKTYNELARMHKDAAEFWGAHGGPAFLPWHREYVKRYEFALRQADPDISLPYWDSALDQNLPDSRDSIMFTNEFMGSTDSCGFLKDGPFANWTTNEGRRILRRVGSINGSLDEPAYSDKAVNDIMNFAEIEKILAYTRQPKNSSCPYDDGDWTPEYRHDMVHDYSGGEQGDMSFLDTAANDPIFFLHHCFVDFVWELWRQRHSDRNDLEDLYPNDNKLCSNELHFKNAPMVPFKKGKYLLKNVDGLSHKYANNLVDYAPRPTCCLEKPDCGSRYLFCDLSHGQPRCLSKVKLGGNCTGFNNSENPCHNGICYNNRCVPKHYKPELPQTTPEPFPELQTLFKNKSCDCDETVMAVLAVQCYKRNQSMVTRHCETYLQDQYIQARTAYCRRFEPTKHAICCELYDKVVTTCGLINFPKYPPNEPVCKVDNCCTCAYLQEARAVCEKIGDRNFIEKRTKHCSKGYNSSPSKDCEKLFEVEYVLKNVETSVKKYASRAPENAYENDPNEYAGQIPESTNEKDQKKYAERVPENRYKNYQKVAPQNLPHKYGRKDSKNDQNKRPYQNTYKQTFEYDPSEVHYEKFEKFIRY